jgi:colicin import membrane protein
MITGSQAYFTQGVEHSVGWPLCISIAVHFFVLGGIMFSPQWRKPEPVYLPGVMDVQMVDLSQVNTSSDTRVQTDTPKTVEEPPKNTPPKPQEMASMTVQQPDNEAKPEVSVAPKQKATKSALKYKTFKSQKVISNALQRVTKSVDTMPPKPLEDTIKRLREKVAKEGKQEPADGSAASEKAGTSKGFGEGRGNQKEIEQIDLYQLEVAYAVQKNWAFADQLAGEKQLMTSIAFKIMPDGRIADIIIMERSGNSYLDDSAYKAILKTSPVKPFPVGLNQPFIQMGLNFTPEGIR